MFSKKLIRHKEFTIPFLAYRAGDITRDELIAILVDLKEMQEEQHEDLHSKLEEDLFLRENHTKIYENLKAAAKHFDEAVELALDATDGPEEEEDEHFEEAMEIFKKGNVLLADAFFAIDDVWEGSGASGQL